MTFDRVEKVGMYMRVGPCTFGMGFCSSLHGLGFRV